MAAVDKLDVVVCIPVVSRTAQYGLLAHGGANDNGLSGGTLGRHGPAAALGIETTMKNQFIPWFQCINFASMIAVK